MADEKVVVFHSLSAPDSVLLTFVRLLHDMSVQLHSDRTSL